MAQNLPWQAGGSRLPTGSRPPPYRMPTGAGIVPGTGRPGSKAGGAGTGALSSQIQVADRPVTQQGLGGMRTGSKGPMRQVYDKSYYMGLVRGKIQELSTEISKLSQEIENHQKENAAYLSYEQRAEGLAEEIKDLRGELADYNTLMDKVNTDTEQAAVTADTIALKMQNDMESRNIDAIFATRQEQESRILQMEEEIRKEKETSEHLVSRMDADTLEKYQKLKAVNISIEKELSEKQMMLDQLVVKTEGLGQELARSDLRSESWRLHRQLATVTGKRDEWREKGKKTPQEEREELLQQVKADNQEIASMQKTTAELQNKVVVVQDKLRQVESELEEDRQERSTKYTALRSREQKMKEFLENFEQTKSEEEEKIRQMESNIVTILEHISQGMTQSQYLPSQTEYAELQADLAFKQEEKEKSEATTRALNSENTKLQHDLAKVEELESKLTGELQMLKENIETMKQDIQKFEDIPALQAREEERRQQLEGEKGRLLTAKEEAKKRAEALAVEYESAKTALEANDTHIQLGNLERKWQHHEKNNFAMKEYIASRQAEGSYQRVSGDVRTLVSSYNSLLCQSTQSNTAAPPAS